MRPFSTGAVRFYTLGSGAHPIAAKGHAPMSFANKGVLITGSTSGIGEACAQVFAESGARVMVSGRDRARGEGVVAAIAAAGGRAEFLAADLRAPGACESLIAGT